MQIDCSLKKNANNPKCKKQVGEGIFSVVIPKADNAGRLIRHSEIKKHVSKLNNHFGGSTTNPTTLGCWNDEERGVLQCETGLKVSSYVDFDSPYAPELQKMDAQERAKKLKEDFNFVKKVAKEIADDFGQDSIPVLFENPKDISFVKGTWEEKMDDNQVQDARAEGHPFDRYI